VGHHQDTTVLTSIRADISPPAAITLPEAVLVEILAAAAAVLVGTASPAPTWWVEIATGHLHQETETGP